MIAVFDKDILLSALIPAMYTVSGKNTMPSIEGIHLTCNYDEKCMIQSYDLEKGMRTYIDCEVEEAGVCIINAQKLLQIVKAMPQGKMKISVDESYKTIIESGLSHFEIKALPGNDFPSLPDLMGDKGFLIPQYLFRNIVNKIFFAVGQNDSRPVFNGAFFKISGDELTAVACDGNRLAISETTAELVNKSRDTSSSLNVKFIVPGKTLAEILKMVKDTEDDMEIRLMRRYVIFKIGAFVFFSKIIDSEYIDYNRILPKTHLIETTVKAQELRGALERSSLIVEDRLAGTIRSYVKFTIDDKFSISTTSANGNVFDEVEMKKEGTSDITIGFNCRFLLDALKVCPDGDVKLSFVNPLMGVTIEPLDTKDGKTTYFVMPVRMNN